MTHEISAQKRKDFENKIKMNYTINKLKLLMNKIDMNDTINLNSFIKLANKRIKETDGVKYQKLYKEMVLQAKIALDYNKIIEEKNAHSSYNIDTGLLLYTESQLIKEGLQSAIDQITRSPQKDKQTYQDIVIYHPTVSRGKEQRMIIQNANEIMTNRLVYDMSSLYDDSLLRNNIVNANINGAKTTVKENAVEMEI